MNKNKVYILEDRGILFVQGKDAKEFLQNLITNDIDKVNETNSCFASLLTPQGKYLFDFLVVKHKNGYFLDCEKIQIENLYNQLDLYKLRSKVEILNLSNEFVVAALSNEKFLEFEGTKNLSGFTIKYREDPVFLDPRKKELGARIIINLEKLYLSLKKFGQENTARIKLKNKLSKRLLPIQLIEGELKEEVIKYNENEIGKVLIKNKFPFASIKYLNENFNEKNEFNCGNAKIKIIKPGWIK